MSASVGMRARGAISHDANVSSDDGLEPSAARLSLQSSRSSRFEASVAPDSDACKFGAACVCLARGHQGRAQGLRCKYGLHTKQEWKDAQARCESAEAASANTAAPAADAGAPVALKVESESSKLKLKHQDRQQEPSKKVKDPSASGAGSMRGGTGTASQAPVSAACDPLKSEPELSKTKAHPQDRQQEQSSKKKQEEKSKVKSSSTVFPSHAVSDFSAASFHVCGLCASGYSIAAVHPCEHRDVCAKCDLKMRTVVNDRRCCFCKNATETVIYADVRRQESYKELLPLCRERNEEWAAVFDSPETRDSVDDLVALGCPICKTRFADETSLKTHVRSVHRLQYCSVCLEQRTALLCEQTLYTEADHKSHMLAHPKCRFCRVSFLDDDKLFVHMERSHLRCHLCHQAGQVYQYFTNLDSFRVHCGDRHFVCGHPECNIDQCKVFASAVELADHELDHKAGSVSRSERARVLQVAFWGATGSQPSFNQEDVARQRGGRGRASVEAGPAVSAAAVPAPSESVEQWPGLGGGNNPGSNAMASAYPTPVTRHELD